MEHAAIFRRSCDEKPIRSAGCRVCSPGSAVRGAGRCVTSAGCCPHHGGGAVVPGARVTLVNPDTTVVREVRSDAAGAYTIDTVPAGSWRVGASAVGRAYAEFPRRVALSDVVQDFALVADIHPGCWTTIGNSDPESLYASNSGSLLPDGTIFYCHDTQGPVRFNSVTGTKTFPGTSLRSKAATSRPCSPTAGSSSSAGRTPATSATRSRPPRHSTR